MATPERFEAVSRLLGDQRGAELENFFMGLELGDAFNSPGRGWGRMKRINTALAAAGLRGDLDDVLDQAAARFADPAVPGPVVEAGDRKPELDERFFGLHDRVLAVSAELFRDRYYEVAVFEAVKAIEVRVKEMTGLTGSGRAVMASAFSAADPLLRINDGGSEVDFDEQEGFMFIYMGVMQGIRNPKAHATIVQRDPNRALDYLSLASLLMRRLDDAEARM